MTPSYHHNQETTHQRLLQLGQPPQVIKDPNDGRISTISCKDAFTIQDGIIINDDITFPLSDPILSDIVINFDYDAYIYVDDDTNNDNSQAMKQIQKVQNRIFNSIIKNSPLVIVDETDDDNSESLFTVTDSTCDELLQDTIEKMMISLGILPSSLSISNSNSRLSTDINDGKWDYYLGFSKIPMDVISENGKCTTSLLTSSQPPIGSTCKPIKSSFTAQIPVNRGLDADIIKTQFLQHVKNGFDNHLFLSDKIPALVFVGARDDSFTTTGVIDDNNSRVGFIEKAAKFVTGFGVSLIVLLALAITIASYIVFTKIRERNNDGDDARKKNTSYFESAQPQSFDDGVEIVASFRKDDTSTIFSDKMEVQTGFKNISVSKWMDSLCNKQ